MRSGMAGKPKAELMFAGSVPGKLINLAALVADVIRPAVYTQTGPTSVAS